MSAAFDNGSPEVAPKSGSTGNQRNEDLPPPEIDLPPPEEDRQPLRGEMPTTYRGSQPPYVGLSLPQVGQPISAEMDARPSWRVRDGLVALAVAVGGSLVAGGVLALVFSIGGAETDGPGFSFGATFVQELMFVAAALLLASASGRLRAGDFGFCSFRLSAFAWVLLAMFVYMTVAVVYAALAHPPQDDLPQSFGADRTVALAVATGILVVGVAPVVEEFFFRGFLYTALRNGMGVWPAALLSGVIFGAIHFKLAFFVPLAVLGVVLALLYQKTKSLWPSIFLHGVNNAIAFAIFIGLKIW